MVQKPFVKDPDAVLDYAFDWTDDAVDPWLQTGESINSHIVTVSAGITKDSDSEADGIITVWLSGGTAGERYVIACKIVTNLGRTDERSAVIYCEER